MNPPGKAFISAGSIDYLMRATQLYDSKKLAKYLGIEDNALRTLSVGGELPLEVCFQIELLTNNSIFSFEKDPVLGISEIYDQDSHLTYNYKLLDSITSDLFLGGKNSLALALNMNERSLYLSLLAITNQCTPIDLEMMYIKSREKKSQNRLLQSKRFSDYRKKLDPKLQFFVVPDLEISRKKSRLIADRLDKFFKETLSRAKRSANSGNCFRSHLEISAHYDLRKKIDSIFNQLRIHKLNLLSSHDWFYSKLLDRDTDVPVSKISILRHRYIFILAPHWQKRLRVHIDQIGDLRINRNILRGTRYHPKRSELSLVT